MPQTQFGTLQRRYAEFKMQNAEFKMQNAEKRFPFSAFRFPLLYSLIRTLTVGIGISPIQSHQIAIYYKSTP